MKIESTATLAELIKVNSIDNLEPLVSLGREGDGIQFDKENIDMLPYTGNDILVRASVRDKLVSAQHHLYKFDEELKLFVAYGYRHPQVQRSYYQKILALIQSREPPVAQDIDEQAHMMIAHPSVAGHPTGGAVDVTLLHRGIPLDMGSKIADFSDQSKIPTFSNQISELQQKNRLLLLEVLKAQGFAPFYGEWWHFSYGDKEWAWFYNQKNAIYEQIEI